MLHIEFQTPLGAKVTVDIEDERKVDDTLRRYGRLGGPAERSRTGATSSLSGMNRTSTGL